MIKAGIIGGAGYTAGELIRILIHHPEVEIDFIYSTSNAGSPISHIHTDLIGETNLYFSNDINPKVDVVFLCLGHGHSGDTLKKHLLKKNTRIIDLSNEFRLRPFNIFENREFTYGLPELQKEVIRQAKNIANPGCFATAIQLAMLPMAKYHHLQNNDIHISAITGTTGAGQALGSTTHFSWRNNNISSYKVFTHQHLGEIHQTLKQLHPAYQGKINFIPLRGNFTRGIFATLYTQTKTTLETVEKEYKMYYKNEPFTVISEMPIHLKQVIGSNKCILHIDKHENKIIVTSILDNLIKGASGQAIQNMNLMFGWEETAGLRLKTIAF